MRGTELLHWLLDDSTPPITKANALTVMVESMSTPLIEQVWGIIAPHVMSDDYFEGILRGDD